MSFASDFIKSSTSYKLGVEDSLNILFAELPQILEMYRVINAFETNHKQEKKNAEKELRKIRKIELSTIKLSKIEEKELRAKKEQCEQTINSSEIIYFKGEPIYDTDIHYQIIKRFGVIVKYLCRVQNSFYNVSSNIAKDHIDKTIEEKGKKSKFWKSMSKTKFHKIIKNKKDIDLNKHKPAVEENDKHHTFNF
jgi:hypothetical protein